jgi:hypothetical protein
MPHLMVNVVMLIPSSNLVLCRFLGGTEVLCFAFVKDLYAGQEEAF